MKINKRLFSLLLSLVLLLFLVLGCGGSKLKSFAPEDALLSIEGQTLMTKQDFDRLWTQQKLSEEIYGVDKMKERDFFIYCAELYILYYYAEVYGFTYSREEALSLYDAYYESLKEGEVSENEVTLYKELKKALAMDDDAFRDWYADNTVMHNSMESLLTDIAESYGGISDPTRMEELITNTVYDLFHSKENAIEIFYPGVTLYSFTYDSIASF